MDNTMFFVNNASVVGGKGCIKVVAAATEAQTTNKIIKNKKKFIIKEDNESTQVLKDVIKCVINRVPSRVW